MPSNNSAPKVPFQKLLLIISDTTRWSILDQLSREEPLPRAAIADRLKAEPTGISRHLKLMVDAGVLHRGPGAIYRITPGLLNPTDRTLDFGPILIRLDQFKPK